MSSYEGDGAWTSSSTDKNKPGYGLPTNCTVGNAGPTPQQAAQASKGTGKTLVQK